MYLTSLEMIQSDCPMIKTSELSDAEIEIVNFDFRYPSLRVRAYINANDRDNLQNTIEFLRSQDKIKNFEIIERLDNYALATIDSEMTNAMQIIREKQWIHNWTF